MAASTRGAFVMMICVLGVTAMGDPAPECKPVCQGGGRNVTLIKVDSEECEVMLCRLQLQHSFTTTNRLRMGCENETLQIRLPKRFRPDERSTLVMRDHNYQRVCYNITTKLTGNVTETPATSCANRTRKKIHLQCTNKDQILLETVLVLNGKKEYRVKMSSATSCKIDKPKASDKTCNCWSPENVKVLPVDKKTLNIEWNPFYADKDLRVVVQRVKENRNLEYRDKIVPNYQLCDSRLHNYTFSNFTPGTYVAMVGSEGCECIVYRESAQITIGDNFPPVTNLPISVSATHIPVDSPHQVYTAVIVTVIGAIAVIAILSFGITYYKKKQPRSYRHVKIENPEMDTGDTLRYTLVHDRSSAESKDTVNTLKVLLDQSHQPDIQVEHVDDIGPIRPRNELLVLVSLQDVHTFEHPTIDSSHWSNTITILKSYMNLKESLVVHVPCNIDHPKFRALRNDARGQSQVVSLHQALNYINPECDCNSHEYKSLVNSTNDDIKNILVISGYVHEHHNRACLELIKMLQKLDKNVAYAFNDNTRKDIQTDGPVSWTLKQLENADLVLVVVSKFLYKLLDCYTKEKEFPDLNTNLGICAPLTLKQMSMRSKRPKIAFVSFGYESSYVDSIVNLCPLLEDSKTYNLVEGQQAEAISHDGGSGEHSALKEFLSRLSSDRSCVHNVSTESGEFFTNVRAMATMMAIDQGWLSKTYGSMQSLASLFTTSQMSLRSWSKDQEMYQTRSQFDIFL